jgi:hypothetical protein
LCQELKSAFPKCSSGLLSGNLGAVTEEQAERFHQDINEMETRHQGRWNVNMMRDYCWLLHRDDPQATYNKRKSTKRSFEGKRKRHYKDPGTK